MIVRQAEYALRYADFIARKDLGGGYMEGLSVQAFRHMKRPHGVEPLASFDLEGRSGVEGQGPFFVFTLGVSADRIAAAAFRSYGCPWSTAIGSVLTKLLVGKGLGAAREITVAQIEAELGGVPRPKRNLVPLALLAVHHATLPSRDREGAVTCSDAEPRPQGNGAVGALSPER